MNIRKLVNKWAISIFKAKVVGKINIPGIKKQVSK